MEKHLISTGFLGFPWKLAYFLWFLPCFVLEDAISALFSLDEREERHARNHAIPVQAAWSVGVERRFDGGGEMDAGGLAPAEADAASAR